MRDLMEVYEEMQKEAAEETETSKVTAEEEEAVSQRIETLAKYAEAADELLAKEYGKDYEEDDVEKLASMLISHDLEQEETIEKIAELDQAGRIMARAFQDELAKLNSDDKDK